MFYVEDIFLKLSEYWKSQGAYIAPSYDVEVGAGTMTPDTFFRVLGRRPWKTAYIQPSRRPDDGRYGENPNRVQKHFQFQVILKPAPQNPQELYIESLKALGIDPLSNFLSFEEDNWESPTIGAWGVGWQVMLNGLEITQFTYFQQAGGIELDPISVEITYGIERIALFLNGESNIYNLYWGEGVKYYDLKFEEEKQFSEYNFEIADVESLKKMFELYEGELKRLIRRELYLPAYDYALKLSHTFNIMDARRAISTTKRVEYISKIRGYVKEIARLYVEKEAQDG